MAPRRPARALERAALALAFAPALWLAGRFAFEGVGPDPIKTLTHATGDWAIRFLLLSLAVTPVRRFAGWRAVAPLRRTFGLAAFAWAAAHGLVWAVLDLGLEPAALLEDVTERPYVMAGMTALAILSVLAATSTRAALRRLGPRWKPLHRAVYVAAAAAVVHHFWLVKADTRPPLVQAALLATLLAARLVWRLRRSAVAPAPTA
ncbi:MAG: ferric reductase-like transmembrane domain-containing protein [Myxococcota bacterium]